MSVRKFQLFRLEKKLSDLLRAVRPVSRHKPFYMNFLKLCSLSLFFFSYNKLRFLEKLIFYILMLNIDAK